MPCSRVAVGVSLLCICLTAVSLEAQFKEPTKEELSMTAEPKAPGAPAIYLDFEDVRDQRADSIVYYERIKVLSEKGKEMATVTWRYYPASEKMPEIEGRTIHADGTVVPMTEKAVNLIEVKTKDLQENKIVFTLPSVEVGSILEYRIKEKWGIGVVSPTWYVQQDQFVRRAHFEFRHYGPLGLSVMSRLPAGSSVKKDKNAWYTLDMTDVPPLPDEEWMPPLNTMKSRVWFFSTDFSSQKEFWETIGKRWAEAAAEVTKPTGKLRQAAASLVDPADTETVKATKLYAAVMQLENTDFSRKIDEAERKKEKIKVADDVEGLWKVRRGSGDELTLLYVALARSAGLKVEPMRVTNRALAVYDSAILDSGQLDDYIAVAQLDGKEVYLDPGQKMCPFGMLFWGHMATYGMRYAGKGADVVRSLDPSYRQTTVIRLADLKVDDTGAVQGQVRVVLTGQEALRWRQLSLRVDESELGKQFNEWVQQSLPAGVQSEFDRFDALAQYESSLTATVRVSGTAGTVTAKRIFLPGLLFEANAKHPFVSQKEREMPVDLHYPYMITDKVVYRLPEGFTLQSGPKTTTVPWERRAALSITVASQPGVLQVQRDLAIGVVILTPESYAGLHEFFQQVAAADQQQVVLVRGAASKGQ